MTNEEVGLVLSGGGMRGAYEVGVLQGIVDVLDCGPDGDSPFDIVSGTSVGAINAAWTAAWSHRGDIHIEGLAEQWLNLKLSTHLRFDFGGVLGVLGGERVRSLLSAPFEKHGFSLLDAEPFEHLIAREIPWGQLHDNIASGDLQALAVAALEVASGETFVFGETHEGVEVSDIEDPLRRFVRGRMDSDHVLASAAIPLLFPARQIEYELFCDGGLRLNTPIPPAIRTGADRLVVISVGETGAFSQSEGEWARAARRAKFPNPVFLAGKALNALLVDPVYQQLQLTRRVNRVVEALEEELDDEQLEAVQQRIAADRGAPYRNVPTLGFSPSESVAELAKEYVETYEAKRMSTRALVSLAGREGGAERDFLSYIFFDGHFARGLIDLGYRDVLDRADEVEAFFAPEVESRD
jgi:NTE family protein